MTSHKLLCVFLLIMLSPINHAKIIARTSETWEGKPIVYPKGEAEITALHLTFEQDVIVPNHCHPMPGAGYILKGTIEVTTENGDKNLMKAGEPFFEVVNTFHKGRVVKGPVEILVFFLGVKGQKVSHLEKDQERCGYSTKIYLQTGQQKAY